MPATPLYINLPLFVAGLIIIIWGSDLFLDNAVWIARASGVSQVIIGATLVSFCTTLPELVSSVTASLRGAADMALGNAVGSVIVNSGLILGVVLLSVTARINRRRFLWRGGFLLFLLVLAFLLMLPPPLWPAIATLGRYVPVFELDRADGVLLLGLVGVYLIVNLHESTQTGQGAASPEVEVDTEHIRPVDWARRGALFAAGGVLVGLGAYLLIEFGQRLARDIGVSEAVISLVFVAFGTSLPELFTAMSAIRKRAQDISVGNLFGANALNIALVVGTSSTIRPLQFQDRMLARLDIPVAVCLTTIVLIDGWVTGKMGCKSGLLILSIYVLYLLSMLIRGQLA